MSIIWTIIIGFVAGIIAKFLMPGDNEPKGFIMTTILGIAGGMGHLMLIQAHRLAPASALAPLIYTQIIWMILAGLLIFGDVPDGWTLIGAAVVVGSGLFILARERALARETSVSQHAE
jgi:drug/metabolite transporter (DMT)-like permease